MDLKLPKMLCKDSKQHHVMFHELNSVSSLLCIAQNVRFEIPYKDLYFETPFLMIFKYNAWASYEDIRLRCVFQSVVEIHEFLVVIDPGSFAVGRTKIRQKVGLIQVFYDELTIGK